MSRDADDIRRASGAPDSVGQGQADLHTASYDAPDVGGVDPDVEDNLGPELELRGDQLEGELMAAREDAASWRDKALRATADLDNFRKRTARERDEERQRAHERIVRELLPVIDNLERAIEHTTAGGDVEQLLGGVEAVHKQLIGVLESEGVQLIDPFGQHFDPNKHQAVSQREDEAFPEHTVVEVLRKGYELGGRVVRPAMVVVSSGGPAGK